jgi:hypothetical protein
VHPSAVQVGRAPVLPLLPVARSAANGPGAVPGLRRRTSPANRPAAPAVRRLAIEQPATTHSRSSGEPATAASQPGQPASTAVSQPGQPASTAVSQPGQQPATAPGDSGQQSATTPGHAAEQPGSARLRGVSGAAAASGQGVLGTSQPPPVSRAHGSAAAAPAPAARLAALAMPDLLVADRPPGTGPIRRIALESAFTPAEIVAPSPASARPFSAAAAVGTPAGNRDLPSGRLTPGSYTPVTHTVASHMPGFHTPGSHTPGSHTPGSHTPGSHTPGSHMQGPHAPGAVWPGTAGLPGESAWPATYQPAAPAIPVRRTSRSTRHTPGTVRRAPRRAGFGVDRPTESGPSVRGYLPAPPPVVVTPSVPAAAAQPPPVPDVAREGSRSLREATAALFRSMQAQPPAGHAEPEPRRGGASMTSPFVEPLRSLSRPAESTAPLRLTPRELDMVVDEVVERIEQRVVDELERRGRRHVTEEF